MANDSNSMRTPLSKVRFLGSARSGTHHAWHMRATSAALVPLTVGFVWLLLMLVGKDYNTVRATLGSPCPAIIMLLFLLAGRALDAARRDRARAGRDSTHPTAGGSLAGTLSSSASSRSASRRAASTSASSRPPARA